VTGYLIICLALTLFVQAVNVYPQLLLARLLFSLGGSAASTMVTAILPAVASSTAVDTGLMTEPTEGGDGHSSPNAAANGHAPSPSIESELTITPARYFSRSNLRQDYKDSAPAPSDIVTSTSRIAGYVGMFTGCGALLALLLFLPLPARFQNAGVSPQQALQYSFYIVAGVAFILAIVCFVGLRGLQEDTKEPAATRGTDADRANPTSESDKTTKSHLGRNLSIAFLAGFRHSEIAMGYLGGFVARASSVGISLFIPLLVNAMFISSGLCDIEQNPDTPAGLPDIKRRCPRAYVVAAELTGVSQMVALIFAPVFGYVSAKVSRRGLPLLAASAAGVIGYPLFATQFDPDDRHEGRRAIAFLAVCLIGVSQIGAIVCSLGILSSGVLSKSFNTPSEVSAAPTTTEEYVRDEIRPLLSSGPPQPALTTTLSSLKGAVAGIYSFYGGAAILILTKVGGSMFDKVSVGSPFYIMAAFNAILMIACALLGLSRSY